MVFIKIVIGIYTIFVFNYENKIQQNCFIVLLKSFKQQLSITNPE